MTGKGLVLDKIFYVGSMDISGKIFGKGLWRKKNLIVHATKHSSKKGVPYIKDKFF
jgi:hypothetical protein